MSAAPVEHIINYLRIDDRLATSGQPTEEELAGAAESGVEVVINLALHDDPRYSLEDERGTVRALGMQYVHIPVQFDAPTRADLDAFCAAMDAHHARKVLVHCAANKRATTFVGLYRVLHQKWDAERAFEAMKTIWEPNAVWSAFIDSVLQAPAQVHR